MGDESNLINQEKLAYLQIKLREENNNKPSRDDVSRILPSIGYVQAGRYLKAMEADG